MSTASQSSATSNLHSKAKSNSDAGSERVGRVTQTADPQVAAFCSSSGPEIFRSIAYPTEIWTPDPLDVETIHEEARDRFDQLLRMATKNDSQRVGRIQLLRGESGSGKTHLMRSLRTRTHQAGDGYFGYMQMTSLTENYGRYVLQKFIDSLDKPYYSDPSRPDPTTGLMRLSLLVAESDRVDRKLIERLRNEEMRIGLPSDIALAMADRIADDPQLGGINTDLVTALLLLQSGQNAVRSRVLKYLRGECLSDYDREHLGGLNTIEMENDAIEMILRIGRLAWATDNDAIVLCIDQLEDLWISPTPDFDPAERFRNAASTLAQIAMRMPNVIIVIACLDDFYETCRNAMPKPVLDRIELEKPTPITLKATRTADEGRQLAQSHLAYLFDHADGPGLSANPTYPIPNAFLDRLDGKRTRDLLRDLQQYRDRCIAEGSLIDPSRIGTKINGGSGVKTNDPGSDKGFADLETHWNDHLNDPNNAPPDDDASLTKLLDTTIDAVVEELADGHRFKSDHEQCDLRILGQTDGHPNTHLFGRVCNLSPQGGALGKRLNDLLSQCDQAPAETTAILIRSTDYQPKTAKSKIAQSLAKLATSGGRRVIVSDTDWRAMKAMQSFRREHCNQPDFGNWLRHSRPLSRLKSIRDLLALDDLVEPTRLKTNTAPSAPITKETVSDPDVSENRNTKPNGPDAANRSSSPSGPQDEIDRVPVGEINVGVARNRSSDRVRLKLDSLRRHAAIVGSTGSGKTTAGLNIVEQLILQDIPVILLDRKGDLAGYAQTRSMLDKATDPVMKRRAEAFEQKCEAIVYTPGQPEGRSIALPIAPEGMRSMNSVDRSRIAVQAARSLGKMLGYRENGRDASRIAVLTQAIELLGTQSDSRIDLNTLIEYIHEKDDDLIAAIGMIDSKVFTGLLENLQTLQITRKLLFTPDAEPLSCDTLFGLDPAASVGKTRLSIINLSFLGDTDNNLFWVSQLLLELSRWMRKEPSDQLRAMVVFDEADLYLPATKKPPTKEPMEDLLKRARSAGLGVMLATQSPGDLDYRCRDNVGTWLIGKIAEENAIKKMKGLLDDCPRDVRGELPGQTTGQFFFVLDSEVTAIMSDRSILKTEQLSEAEILNLARRDSTLSVSSS